MKIKGRFVYVGFSNDFLEIQRIEILFLQKDDERFLNRVFSFLEASVLVVHGKLSLYRMNIIAFFSYYL